MNMNESDPAIRTTLRIPGNWSHPGELVERMSAGFRLTSDALILPDLTEIEFTPMPPDDQFAEVFKSACRQPATNEEMDIVNSYTVNVVLTGPGGSYPLIGQHEDVAVKEHQLNREGLWHLQLFQRLADRREPGDGDQNDGGTRSQQS